MKRVGAALILSALVGGMSLPVFAIEEAKDIVLVGDAKCTKCHDEADDPKVLAVGKTRHGVNADKQDFCVRAYCTFPEFLWRC